MYTSCTKMPFLPLVGFSAVTLINTKDPWEQRKLIVTVHENTWSLHDVSTQELVLRPARTVVKILGTYNVHELWKTAWAPSTYLSGPSGMFCLYVILTISYLQAQTIETSSLPTDSSRPLFKDLQALTVWLYDCMTVDFNIRKLLECLLGTLPSGRNPCGGNK